VNVYEGHSMAVGIDTVIVDRPKQGGIILPRCSFAGFFSTSLVSNQCELSSAFRNRPCVSFTVPGCFAAMFVDFIFLA
jgi:hypothetical protein